MSVVSITNRIAELQAAFLPPAPPSPAAPSAFSGMLASASAQAPALSAAGFSPVATPGAPTPGAQAMLDAARNEVGVAEEPLGSNDSPRIAQYRQATAGAGVGPWCAYFTSWAARQGGVPLGDQGQGFGSVDALYSWAQRAGKAIPAGPGVTPQPGDLMVFDEHVGMVESVAPDGTVNTIEGNSSDQVIRRRHPGGGGAVGYVRLG
jgi:CHAP domain